MSSQLWSYRLALAAAFFFGIIGMAITEPIKEISPRQSETPPVSNFPTLCSDINTGSTPQSKMLPQTLVNRILTNSCALDSSIYQSHGLCTDFCAANYAFAIMQDAGCWCSNYAPDQTTSTFDCALGCPGYPQDSCGSANGLFAYESVVGRLPSGTTTGAIAVPSSSSSLDQVSTPYSHVP
jgi:cell wall integrity and stress response component